MKKRELFSIILTVITRKAISFQKMAWAVYYSVSSNIFFLYFHSGLLILKAEWLHAHFLSLLIFIWKTGISGNLAFKSLLTFFFRSTDPARNQFEKKSDCYQSSPIPVLYKKFLIMLVRTWRIGMNIFKVDKMRKDMGKKGWKWSQLGIKQGPCVKIAVCIFIFKIK